MTDRHRRLDIDSLGAPSLPSPLDLSTVPHDGKADFAQADASVRLEETGVKGDVLELERAGPRELVYFDGPSVNAGIVTCGGLCPGLNNVIRDLVNTLWHRYAVRRITGFRYGFDGLTRNPFAPTVQLSPQSVARIHLDGGSILGSSRGPRDPREIVEHLHDLGINMLFCVGGDGTMRGTHQLYDTARALKMECAFVGLPKTIDNDLSFTERSFGFETAVSLATQAIRAARVEASGCPLGVGLVKLMGRHAGFIAASAVLASRDVDLVLVPEQSFDLDSVTNCVRGILKQRGEAVVVVAEGAGQEFLGASNEEDASGNQRLLDVGLFLKGHFTTQLAAMGAEVKYIDPSYMIRAASATPADSIFCGRLAENAVHAAMTGKTGLMLGLWANRFVHVPLSAVIGEKKQIDLDGPFWRSVVEATGQPAAFVEASSKC